MHEHVGRGGVALTAPWWRGADRADEKAGATPGAMPPTPAGRRSPAAP